MFCSESDIIWSCSTEDVQSFVQYEPHQRPADSIWSESTRWNENVNGKVKSNYRAHEQLVLLLGEILLCEQVMEHLEWVPYWVWQRSPPFGADPPFGTDICYVWGVCVRPDPSPPNNDCQQSQWSSMTRILYVLCRDMTIRWWLFAVEIKPAECDRRRRS